MGPIENPTNPAEKQDGAGGGGWPVARGRRGCLLKGCEQRFHPGQAQSTVLQRGVPKGGAEW